MDTMTPQPFWHRGIFVHRLIPMSVGAVLATVVVYVAMPAHAPVMPLVLAVGLLIGLAVGLRNDHVAAQPNTIEANPIA
jgi:ribose/xylose/arabinose/galactoside ABC-type transport system permease subunit